MMFNWIKSLFKKPAQKPVVLGWNHNWTIFIEQVVHGDTLKTLSCASDILTLKPNYKTLSDDDKVKVWCDFFQALSYFESCYDPKSQSVDVGVYSDKNTWSIGLLQLSVIDQSNLGLRFGYDFNDLLDPYNNLKFGIEIMKNQIRKRGKIFIPHGEKGNPSLYWATLSPGGKYDKSQKVIEWVQHEMD